VLFEELGRSLYPGPFFATVALALPALAGSDLLAAVISGERSATAALDGGVTATGRRLTGTARLVPDAALADDVVVPTDDALWVVDLREHRGVVTPLSTMDRTRRLADLHLDATPATRLDVDPVAVRERIRLRALAALACEAVGAGEACLRVVGDYAKTRQQFGRVIGTYQGVSHRIANIYVAVELAKSLAYWAAWCVDTDDAQAEVATAAAKSAAGEAAVFAAENAIQSMGGIGFTWDHPLHRYYKRAQWIDAYDGFGRTQRARVAAALLDA
jgi:alkylation response protein AidB-like acyl-CoA dehydrogenase